MKVIIFSTLVCVFIIVSSFHALAEEKATKQTFSFELLMSPERPQIAIWLTDSQGTFIDTVYVTYKTAKGYGNRGGSIDDRMGGSRLSILPVWAHSRGIDYGNGNFYPTYDKPLPDAITSATPRVGEFKWIWNPENNILKPGKYFYYVEVNAAFDKNEHHDYSWYRGQPSVVWQGSIIVGNKSDKNEAQIIGHGHVAGEDGQVNPDLTSLTTSLKLIEKVTASYNP